MNNYIKKSIKTTKSWIALDQVTSGEGTWPGAWESHVQVEASTWLSAQTGHSSKKYPRLYTSSTQPMYYYALQL